MVRKMTYLLLVILIVGCGQVTPQAENADVNEAAMLSNIELQLDGLATDITEATMETSPILTDTEEIVPTGGIELMIPSNEFMDMRDEILIHILGIDGNVPVYNTFWSELDQVEVKLPYGGVLAKLGEFAYRTPFSSLDLGFDVDPGATYRLFYPEEGLELDVSYSGDRPYNVVRYLYISNKSEVKLPSGIGIGSLRAEVIAIYESHIITDFCPMLTTEEVIALGSDMNGIYFVLRDGSVFSIYVGIIREDSIYASVFSPNSGVRLYPDRFYPDREYMEMARENEQ